MMVTHVSPQARNAAVPAELKNLHQWACYIKGSRDKMPATPDEWTMKWGDRSNWLAFDEVSSYEKIGWFPTLENGILIVDFDGCRNAETGEMHPLAQSYLEQLKHTYCELSQSREGFKAYVRGTLPTDKPILNKDVPWKAPSGSGHEGIEIYAQKHFIAVTGNRLSGCASEINPAPSVLNDLLTRFAKAPKVRGNPTPSPTTGNWDIDRWVNQHLEVVEKLADGYIVVCPWAHEHSTDHNTARIWSGPPHTFNCFHAHCDGREWNDVRLKHEPTAYDKRESPLINEIEDRLRKERKGTEGKQDKKELPEFIIQGQLRDQVREALKVLRIANEKETRMFVYLSTISKIEYDEKGDPIIMQLEKAGLRNELSDAADFKTWKKVKEERFLVDAHPPKDLAEQLLALAPRKWGLPSLKAIVEAPVLRSDGSVLTRPGYDQQTGLYYIPSSGMENCEIPENPSQQDAIKAMTRIKALFADFPFEGPADYANTIALLFTPFVRYAVKRDIQMALIDATNPGTGKGLITIVISIVATGRSTTPISAKQNEEEWRKAIFAELLRAPRIVIIDNIKSGTALESAALDLMLTGNGLNERILGHSKSASPKNEATWIATGNNLMVAGDLARRCYRIRLISETATPEERDDFSIKDLEQHTIDNRQRYVSDVLTIARAWYAVGKPQPSKVPNLATFTDWAKTVGGMLEFAGVEGFQGNRVELRSRNNEEGQEWEAFFSTWLEEFGTNWKSASDVATKIKETDDQSPANSLSSALPQCLKSALADKPKTLHVKLGNELEKRVQTVYGPSRLRVEKEWDKHKKGWVWRVTRVIAGVSTSQSEFEKNSGPSERESQADDTATSAQTENSENVNDLFEHPQTPANMNGHQTADRQKTDSVSSTSHSEPIGDDLGEKGFAGVQKESSAIYRVNLIPTEYLVLFTDYKMKIDSLPVDAPIWRAPDSGHPCHKQMPKESHINFTKELLTSGMEKRVNAAVEAMKRTLGTWED